MKRIFVTCFILLFAATSVFSQTDNGNQTDWSMILGLVGWVVFIAILAVMYRVFKKNARKIFIDYYTQKRAQFPWLEEWIENNTNPALPRADAATMNAISSTFWYTIIGCIVLGFLLSKFLNLPIGVEFVILLAVIFGSLKYAERLIKCPSYEATADPELTLECPSCGCPHAWQMVHMDVKVHEWETVDNSTTTKTWEEDASGKKVFGSEKTKTNIRITTYYTCNVKTDFECSNCGHAKQTEAVETWDRKGKHHPDNVTSMEDTSTLGLPVGAWTGKTAKPSVKIRKKKGGIVLGLVFGVVCGLLITILANWILDGLTGAGLETTHFIICVAAIMGLFFLFWRRRSIFWLVVFFALAALGGYIAIEKPPFDETKTETIEEVEK